MSLGSASAAPSQYQQDKMTFVLALTNREQAILLSDRRLVCNGAVCEDEACKIGVLECHDARLAFAFTGLAKAGQFDTRSWLLDALHDCSLPDCTAFGILQRLNAQATNKFICRSLSELPDEHRRVSIIFSGYRYHTEPPLAVFAIMTNYQDFATGTDDQRTWNEFKTTYWWEKEPREKDFTMVQRIGRWNAMTREDEVVLRVMLRGAKPERAMLGKAVELMRDIAARPAAGGVIGSQILSAIIPRDLKNRVKSSYHVSNAKHEVHIPDRVRVLSPDQRIIVRDISISVSEPGPPLVVQTARGKAPCPCGSGLKYGKCHGKEANAWR